MHAAALARTCLALTLALPAAAANQVHVVDDLPGPGVDFTSLQAAINAAAEGDVILLKSGTHFATGGTVPTFSLVGKSLTLVADVLPSVVLSSPLAVSALGAGQQVTLRGLKIQITDSGTALNLFNNAGSVWVEDCTLSSASTIFPFLPAGHGVQASSCASLILARCALSGSSITTSSSPGYHGLASSNTNVCLYDCSLQGGNGGAGSAFFVGGDGANLASGFLHAADCTFTGGKGGKGTDAVLFTPCSNGAEGGDGLHLASGAVSASTLASAFAGGTGGAAGNPGTGTPCSAGAPGLAIRVTVGTHTALPGPAHGLVVGDVSGQPVVREGQTLFKTYTGPAGELVFADYSGFQGFTYFANFSGVLVLSLAQPFVTVFEGTMPAGGQLVRTVVINPLPAGKEGKTVYIQGGFYNFTTGIFQGAPSAPVLLDSAF